MNRIYSIFRRKVRDYLLYLLSVNSRPKPGIHILNGHFLSLNDKAESVIFKNQLFKLSNKGVRFIDFDKAVVKIENDDIPKHECLVAFTFDDGFEECYTKIKPILDEYNLKAGFFINPNFINGDENYQDNFKKHIVFTNKAPMNWSQIENLLKNGHIIGSHTMDHHNLNSNKTDFLNYQIIESKRYLEIKLNYKCEYFAFPFGTLNHVSNKGIDIAKKHYKYIFSQSNYRNYYSFGNKVINRRHFECDWPYKHVLFFLKSKKYE